MTQNVNVISQHVGEGNMGTLLKFLAQLYDGEIAFKKIDTLTMYEAKHTFESVVEK